MALALSHQRIIRGVTLGLQFEDTVSSYKFILELNVLMFRKIEKNHRTINSRPDILLNHWTKLYKGKKFRHKAAKITKTG